MAKIRLEQCFYFVFLFCWCVTAVDVQRKADKDFGDIINDVSQDECNSIGNGVWYSEYQTCKCMPDHTFHVVEGKVGCFKSSNDIVKECSSTAPVKLLSSDGGKVNTALTNCNTSFFVYAQSVWSLTKGYVRKNRSKFEIKLSDGVLDGKLIKVRYTCDFGQTTDCFVVKLKGTDVYPESIFDSLFTSTTYSPSSTTDSTSTTDFMSPTNSTSTTTKVTTTTFVEPTNDKSTALSSETIGAIVAICVLLLLILLLALFWIKRRRTSSPDKANKMMSAEKPKTEKKPLDTAPSSHYASLNLNAVNQSQYGVLNNTNDGEHLYSSPEDIGVKQQNIYEPSYFETEPEK